MKAMVLAAGRGTRLRPLTDARPKALVEVGGRTLLEHVLRRLGAAGVTEVIINLHHLGAQIPPFLERHRNFGLERVAFSDEPLLLGTGGGLKQAAAFFDDGRPFLLHNVDVLSDIDLRALLAVHRRNHALATLAVMDRPTERPLLFDGDGRLVGRRTADAGDVVVRGARGGITALGFCGIQALSTAFLERITEAGAFPITEPYLRLAGTGAAINGCRVDGARWRDCGRPEDLRPL
ncbi:MAG TPA: sugar phosphate nucleotidyltransferase [Opitutaceae bacterium]|nr:sugar phosphate nucleotidyltransferase [Opitutaceae bacterium]